MVSLGEKTEWNLALQTILNLFLIGGGKMEMNFVILRFPLFPAWNVAQFGRDGAQVRL